MHEYEFTLYVSERRGGGLRAIDSVERVCELHLKDNYNLKVVDIGESPEETERSLVLATPTLVIEHPPPKRRVTGCFEDLSSLARAMGIGEESSDGAPQDPSREDWIGNPTDASHRSKRGKG